MNKLPAQPVTGLIDGMKVLQELAVSRAEVSCKHISDVSGINYTRVNRILKTLAHMDIVYRTKSRRYRPGPGMHILSVQSMVGSGLLSGALPVLEELARPGFTVALGTLWRDTVSYLYHGEYGIPTEDAVGRMSLYPALKSSIGLALLAEKEDSEIDKFFMDERKRSEAYTKIRITRQKSFASLKTAEGITSTAVTAGHPPFAGIALSGPVAETETDALVMELEKAAKKIEENMR
jgi:DNA-binding IclR family transcriptional regulator